MYSKSQRNITLHHAVLVLNFATLSTIASIAAAPMVPIWRRVRHGGKSAESYDREVEDRTRGRIILSFALLAQIVMQWLWAIIIFVDPFYAQNPVSAGLLKYVFSLTSDLLSSAPDLHTSSSLVATRPQMKSMTISESGPFGYFFVSVAV